MPAIPFDRTILMPTAMCSQVPRLSPVHIAPYRCEPAKNERVRTKGRLGVAPRAIKPSEVTFGRNIPLMLWTSRCSQPPWWIKSLGIVISGPLNTEGWMGYKAVSARATLNSRDTYLVHVIPNIDVLSALRPLYKGSNSSHASSRPFTLTLSLLSSWSISI
jgi:hypothetical protein